MRKEPQAKEHRQPLEAGKYKKTCPTAEPAEGAQSCPRLDFIPLGLTLDFRPEDVFDSKSVLSHKLVVIY